MITFKNGENKMASDELGDIIKSYEAVETSRKTMKGLPVIMRLDGRSFSKFTKGMKRPYDEDMAGLMIETGKILLKEFNAIVCYHQSDELSLILDSNVSELGIKESFANGFLSFFRREKGKDVTNSAEIMFDGKYQKLCSVASGLASAYFAVNAYKIWPNKVEKQMPHFDCRVFTVPSKEEAVAALAWREWDATKNAVSMLTRTYFSHKEMHAKSSKDMKSMLETEKGIVFSNYPAHFRRGTYLKRVPEIRILTEEEMSKIPEGKRPLDGKVIRSVIKPLDLPPISRLENPLEVIYGTEEPRLKA